MTWEQFFEWLMKWEGKTITNDPRDPGGQTAWGIARKFNPEWPGWRSVDAGVTSGPAFEAMVSEFYRNKYRPIWDALPERVREATVDAVVNMGPGRKGDDLLGGIELLPDLPLDAIQIASAQDGLLSRFFVGQAHFALLAGQCVNSFD